MKAISIALFAGAITCAFFKPCASANTFKEKVLYSFCSQADCADGSRPNGLIVVGGTLYGTTGAGGGGPYCVNSSVCGTVFSVDAKTGTEKVLYSFCSQPNCSDGQYADDGQYSYYGLIEKKGTLYGTTNGGGGAAYCMRSGGCGTVFSVDAKSGAEKVLYSLCSKAGCADGENSWAGPIDEKGTLYGTTVDGGAHGSSDMGGTVFSVDAKSGTEKVLYSFCRQGGCDDGEYPQSSLLDEKGTLYGTTWGGGPTYGGTVFSVDAKTRTEKVVYSFGGADGWRPWGALIDVKGTLYGTTFYGGANCQGGCGTVFSLDTNTGTEKVLHSFCSQPNCSDGAYPEAGLIDVEGTLYGTTTEGGGASHGGKVFSVDAQTGAEKVLYSFCRKKNCTDGVYPYGGLIDVEGTLYGTTLGGGTNGYGTVFSVAP